MGPPRENIPRVSGLAVAWRWVVYMGERSENQYLHGGSCFGAFLLGPLGRCFGFTLKRAEHT